MELKSIHLPHKPPTSTYDITISRAGKISSIRPSSSSSSSSNSSSSSSLLLPSLCHPHLHLDKPFLLSSDNPQYFPLLPKTGTFTEALTNTARAKSLYTYPDLLRRGSQLLAESVRAGVTSLRAFVEVDATVGLLGLEVAAELKRRFRPVCYVQIVAFAQEAIFSGETGEANRRVLEEVLEQRGREDFPVEVLGTTPYVEDGREMAHANIEWAVRKALQYGLHLDFHLDYNLDGAVEPMVYHVLDTLEREGWPQKASSSSSSSSSNANPKTIALAHLTRLTLLSPSEFSQLASRIRASDLPLSLIGLPSSDLYTMGRPSTDPSSASLSSPRATLPLPFLAQQYNLSVALGVNNLLNPFTPQGTADPLQLASWSVGVYQAGREEDASLLYQMVSGGARRVIGLEAGGGGEVREGKERLRLGVEIEEGDGGGMGEGFVVFQGEGDLDIEGLEMPVPGRGVRSVRDVVWSPPETARRRIVGFSRGGKGDGNGGGEEGE